MATVFAIIGWVLLALAVFTTVCCWWMEEREMAKTIALVTVFAFLVLRYL